MSKSYQRLAIGALTVMMSLAVVGVSTAHAEEDGPIISTTCGAGTLTTCGEKSIQTCDLEFTVILDPTDKNFGISFKRTNCRSTGSMTLYKDYTDRSSLSTSCETLLGMPARIGCLE
jgi:hypothetical protein